MSRAIVTVQIRYEQDVVLMRQRAKQIAALLGFDAQDQTRFATSVSEVARNAFRYAGGGKGEFLIEEDGRVLTARISDTGPGIPHLQTVLSGNYQSKTGMGLGIIGAKRLSDRFNIQAMPGQGTVISLGKFIPGNKPVPSTTIGALADQLSRTTPLSAFDEVQQQNQELLGTLEALRARQAEVEELNRQLTENNRGILALYSELDEKAESLRKASELKTRFLSQMTHELRTPLNSIVMLSRMLQGGTDGELNEEQSKQAEFIRKSSESLLEMVNDLLDLAKIEAGKIEVRVSEFSIASLFGALRGMFRPIMPNHPNVELVIEPPPESLPLMSTDEGKVSQVLRNLISNGLKFTERGTVTVRAEECGDEQITFAVRDTGPGISPQDQQKLFHDFTQLDSVAKKGIKGTGLGLSLSRQFASLLQGRLDVISEVGAGSTFSLTIPLRYQSADPPAAAEMKEDVHHAK